MFLKIFFVFPAFLLLFQTSFVPNAAGQTTDTADKLELNAPFEREIAGGQTHKFQINAPAGQYVNLIIEQRGTDVSARIADKDGKLVFEVNEADSAQERIELVAEKSENYVIEISPVLPKMTAGKYTIRLTEIRTATANEKLLDEARRQFAEALRQNEAGNFDAALELFHRVLETREKILTANNAETAKAMLWESRLYLTKNNLAQAETFQRRASEAFAKISDVESLNNADVLTVSGQIRQAQTNYAEAENLYRQSLTIREKAAGANSTAAASSLHNLGVLYRAMNDYAKSEQNFAKSLTIYENLFGENRFEMALLLNNFGMFYYGAGNFDKALALLRRSLAIKEKMYPAVHRQIGIAFNNLGLVAWKKGEYEKARDYYLRALSIFEVVNGAESDGVANILGNLGTIYKEQDANLAKAEEFYKRSLAIKEKISGEFHPATADAVTSLAILYRRMGDIERAEQFGLRALGIYEKVSGEYNHYTMLAIFSLARIYAIEGDAVRAFEYAKRLSDIHEKIIPLNLRIGSEEQKIKYYDFTERFDKTITLHANFDRENADMRELALNAVLRHKGRIMDAVSENLSALRLRFNAEDQELLDDLNETNSRLSKTLLSNPQKTSAAERQKQIKILETEREKLETEISRASAGFFEPSRTVTVESVRAEIPADSALVEFAVYRPFDWKADSEEAGSGNPRYIVYILRPSGEIKWKDLGETAAIDGALDEFRKALRDPKSTNVQKIARTTDEKIMKPIRALVGDARHLLISPDGNLNLIPFEALVDEQGKYLVENYSFSYLTSGRDLLRMQTARANKSNILVVANPLFGALANEETAVEKTNKTRLKRRSITATRNMSDTYFTPLAGTIQEARAIQNQFPDAQILSGETATETTLKKINAPRILHIATHGFFLENTGEINQPQTRSTNVKPESENPLLRSGIALAGANRRDGAAQDNGILTALEASGLNLWGTKLVVLSACDTGLGEVKNGEGVYGLRRAFVLAGAESLIMSLWSVEDQITRRLMTEYYKNLKAGIGRGAALRQAQLEMLKRKDREHPFYWAAFIQSGEWANLEGKRQ